jgi:hypothetical protein
MNDSYLSRFWGNDYQVLLSSAGVGRVLPAHWASIADADQGRRLEGFKALVSLAFIHMPETSDVLRKASDAYLVKIGDDIALVVDRQSGGKTFSYRGFAPASPSMFGGSVGAFYNAIDGFCDFHSMGGLLPQRDIRPIGKDGNEYWTEPSATLFETVQTKDYFHIFNSGGKGQGYISLHSTVVDDPEGLLLWTDDDEPMTNMSFWNLFDAWTSAAMAD